MTITFIFILALEILSISVLAWLLIRRRQKRRSQATFKKASEEDEIDDEMTNW